MKSVKFIKTKYGTCICLDHSLFENEIDKAIKTIETLDLFSSEIIKYEGFIFVNENYELIKKELNNLNCFYELICTNKVLFTKNKENKLKLIFNNEQASKIINLILKHNLTFDGIGCINNDNIILRIVINDHDGSYITFNNKVFEEKETYKQLMNKIFK